MKGKHDDHLRWPFKGTVTISLLDQLGDNQHHTRTIHLGISVNHADTVEKPESDKIRNEAGWGFPKFISLSKVESSTDHKQYLMNDTLYLKISATVTK